MRQVGYLLLVLMIALFSCDSDTITHGAEWNLKKSGIIDSICQTIIDKGNTKGFSISISKDKKIVYSKGFGFANIQSETPATENTIYAIASVSKFITSVMTLKFVEEGKLNLTDKVIDHLPNFPRQEHMDEIKIDHLLRHQSGLPDHEDWFDSIYIHHGRVFTPQEHLQFLDQPLFFRPGSRYLYSNSGYAVLSTILEKIGDMPYHELIKKYISEPHNVNSIGSWPEQWNLPNASMGYELTNNGVDTSLHMMTAAMKGDGGLSASTTDLVRFIDAVADSEVISNNSLQLLLGKTQIGDVVLDYGLGARSGIIRGQRTWGHSGGYKGTGWSNVTHYPESGYTFAAAMNTNYSPEEIWNLRHDIMPVVLGLTKPDFKIKPVKNKELYEGVYTDLDRWSSRTQSIRNVSFNGDTLIWDNPDTPTPGFKMIKIREHTFGHRLYPYDEFVFHVVDNKVIAVSEFLDGSFVGVRMKLKH